MAANATSAALMLSDIPWGGPIGMIRIGRISGQFIVNPTMDELCFSDLNLVYACTKDKTLMMDVQARGISEKDLEAGLRLAHPEMLDCDYLTIQAVKYLEPQIRLAAKAGKGKKDYKLSMLSDRTLERVRELAEAPIEAVFSDPTYGKFERGGALDNITQDVKKVLEEECDGESLNVLSKTVDTVRKQVVRRRIISEGLRVDGRRLDEVRPLYCEAGNLPQLHGSSLFSRGDTQVLCTVTLGSPADAQRLDSIVGSSSKRFMLHYSFPPFCINEVGKRGGLNRREVGHGTLAEKALLAVLPPEDDFPYVVRINSEVMASDGSTSMATVCGGSMALMDAGISLREHVAGVSVGLVSEVDPSTGKIKDYRILTDILGLEDHLGDMDFKIAGTRKGVTAIQLDIKPAGIPLDIICESLEHARKGRIQILDQMEKEINAPRDQDDNSPQLATLKYSNDLLRRLVGPLGALKRKIEEETGGRLSVSDGTLSIVAKNKAIMEKVKEKIDFLLGREIEIGGVYKGVVTSVKEYGAFVEFNGGQQGLLHISELSHEPVSRPSEVVSVGQKITAKCIGQDVRGNIKLSLKATIPQSGSVKRNVAKASFPSSKEEVEYSASEENMCNAGEKQNNITDTLDAFLVNKNEVSDVNPSQFSVPPILIRSAAECDEEEKSAGLTEKSKTKSRSLGASEADGKSKPSLRKKGDKRLNSKSKSKDGEEITQILKSDTSNRSNLDDSEAETRTTISAKSLKLGTKVTAKVFQVRTNGLILDLGGDIRGMYLFESNEILFNRVAKGPCVFMQTNGRRDFEEGDELRVQCTRFNRKGVPVMSLVDDD
ncbi:Polyribonucleotide nucleotidyltransferase [Morus notabilis]|uniref:polyribonucleotide nucleotidyltransferase n=1 Tax=Morus notabilis TaxID=981085 RepID=W9S8R4_9ROSA|nr:Polyribonucleotide nucleotidyltransferase [Morus notabilis]